MVLSEAKKLCPLCINLHNAATIVNSLQLLSETTNHGFISNPTFVKSVVDLW
jgi:hypothetical protein